MACFEHVLLSIQEHLERVVKCNERVRQDMYYNTCCFTTYLTHIVYVSGRSEAAMSKKLCPAVGTRPMFTAGVSRVLTGRADYVSAVVRRGK